MKHCALSRDKTLKNSIVFRFELSSSTIIFMSNSTTQKSSSLSSLLIKLHQNNAIASYKKSLDTCLVEPIFQLNYRFLFPTGHKHKLTIKSIYLIFFLGKSTINLFSFLHHHCVQLVDKLLGAFVINFNFDDANEGEKKKPSDRLDQTMNDLSWKRHNRLDIYLRLENNSTKKQAKSSSSPTFINRKKHTHTQ